jgi:hypothetical protein
MACRLLHHVLARSLQAGDEVTRFSEGGGSGPATGHAIMTCSLRQMRCPSFKLSARDWMD